MAVRFNAEEAKLQALLDRGRIGNAHQSALINLAGDQRRRCCELLVMSVQSDDAEAELDGAAHAFGCGL